MSSNLKIKNIDSHLKQKNTDEKLHCNIKNIGLKSKIDSIKQSFDYEVNNSEQKQENYAINKIVSTEKSTAYRSTSKLKQQFKESKAKSKIKKKMEQTTSLKKKDVLYSNEQPSSTSTNKDNVVSVQQKPIKQSIIKRETQVNSQKKLHSIRNGLTSHRNEPIKFPSEKLSRNRLLFKKKLNNQTLHSTKTIRSKVTSGLKASFQFIKKSVLSINRLLSLGTALILLLVITLFIGVFAALSDNSTVGSIYEPLSPEVIAYQETIEKYAKKYGMEDYVPIISAVMMQESGGKGTDPMQASECPYNTKYPKKPNGIEEPEYSIEVGIHYLSDCFKQAGVKDIFNNDHISLALQGYNYGNGYIQWAITNFGGYSKANAKVFSDQKKAELGWDTYGDPYYVEHVMRYVGLGFGNYREQPNFNNTEAWGSNNPYSRVGLYGQCTWFAWGRFYEIHGYSPGFTGDGWKCAKQLVSAHPDKFKISNTPAVGAIFSCIGRNHVGIVIGWDGTNITIQEGNLDGKTNSFAEAKKDWHTVTYTLSQFVSICHGVEFAIPIN